MSFSYANSKLIGGATISTCEKSTFDLRVQVVNELQNDVVALDHNNNYFVIKRSRATVSYNRLVIYMTYSFPKEDSIKGTFEIIRKVRELRHRGEVVNTIYEDLIERDTEKKLGFSLCSVTIQIEVKEADFLRNPSIFEENSNLLFSIAPVYDAVHPGSRKARIESSPDLGFTENDVPSGFAFEIIDNDGGEYKRFIHMANNVVSVPVRVNLQKPNGLYVTKIDGSNNRKVQVSTTFYSMEPETGKISFDQVLERYGIYKSKEEAESNGKPDVILAAQNKQLDKELNEGRVKLERLKQEFAAEKLEHQKEVLRLEQEKAVFKDKMETKALRDNDYYESRSAERKDTSEWIKFIPAVLMGFIGAALLFRK
jgi:hypothetical protein